MSKIKVNTTNTVMSDGKVILLLNMLNMRKVLLYLLSEMEICTRMTHRAKPMDVRFISAGKRFDKYIKLAIAVEARPKAYITAPRLSFLTFLIIPKNTQINAHDHVSMYKTTVCGKNHEPM